MPAHTSLFKFSLKASGRKISFTVMVTLLSWVLSGNLASGQVMMVDQAYTLLKQGRLDKSKQTIDIAVKNSSVAKNAKAWYLRSYIYQQLAEEKTDSVHHFRHVSIRSAEHCLSIDDAQQYTEDCQSLITHAYTGFLNEAIAYLNQQQYDRVLPMLQPIVDSKNELSGSYRPEALFYYGYTLLQLNEKSKARDYLYNSLQSGYQDALIYEMEFAHRLSSQQPDSAQWYLARGRSQFPKDANLHIAELNFLMQQENYQKAEQSVKQYLQRHPDDIEGLLLGGTIYEKLLAIEQNEARYFDQQKTMYERVLQIDPNHVQANYNLGIAYYNRGVSSINRAAKNYDLDIIQFNQLLEECSTLFLSALPYLERVNQLDRTHINALKALQGVYYNINDYEQYNQVKAKLQRL